MRWHILNIKNFLLIAFISFEFIKNFFSKFIKRKFDILHVNYFFPQKKNLFCHRNFLILFFFAFLRPKNLCIEILIVQYFC